MGKVRKGQDKREGQITSLYGRVRNNKNSGLIIHTLQTSQLQF